MDRYSDTAPRRRSFRKIGCITLLVLALIIGIIVYWRYYNTFSEGTRAGLLQKFSHKGNLFKTYEGEIIQGSIRSNTTTPIGLEKFLFSVTEKRVADKLMNLQGQNITVHYNEKRSTLFYRGDSKYIVDSVWLTGGQQ
jgi:hypothetical protein